MSYRGRPSKGCESCRARKVKCDEAKPVCSRCSKANHECKYRDQGDLLFRNQTAIAAQKAEDSWRKRAKPHQRSESASSASHQISPASTRESPQQSYHQTPHDDYQGFAQNDAFAEASSSVLTLNNLSLGYQPLQPDLQRLAYERFVYDYVVFDNPHRDMSQPSSALWDFIPPLYQSAGEGSSLATIVHAVSYANFRVRCNAPQAQVLGEQCLAKGMKLLQKTLADKTLAPTDHALCSVYLLGVYEQLSTPFHNGSFLAHKQGANALLQLRTIEQFFSNPVSARLYEVSYAQMLIGNLHSGLPPNLPVRNLVAARQYLPSLYSTSGIYVIQLIHQEASLHARWHAIKSSPNPPSDRQGLQDILRCALELDADFQSWEATIPPAWRYQMERNTPEARNTHEPKWRDLILCSRGAPEEIHTYTALKKCWIWMFYRTSRLFLLRDLLEILNWTFRLPIIDPNRSPPQFDQAATIPETAHSMPLDDVSLSIHHSFATTHLVTIIEKSCSAVLGSFTVPIYGKSNNDVVGMRGYTSFWSLGVMDSVLRSGLIPDSGAPPSPPSSTTVSPKPLGPLAFSQFHGQPAPSPSMFKLPSQTIHPLYHNPATAVPNPQDFPKLPAIPFPSPPASHASPPVSPPDAGFSSLPHVDPPKPPHRHPFDAKEPHPFDSPTNLPTLDFSITKPTKIDVAARREWIHRLMYYMGTRLGIKKGLAVVYLEGYMEVSKREVDKVFGS